MGQQSNRPFRVKMAAAHLGWNGYRANANSCILHPPEKLYVPSGFIELKSCCRPIFVCPCVLFLPFFVGIYSIMGVPSSPEMAPPLVSNANSFSS
jgi:hypothetical protein